MNYIKCETQTSHKHVVHTDQTFVTHLMLSTDHIMHCNCYDYEGLGSYVRTLTLTELNSTLTELPHAASLNDKRVGAIPPLQFYPTNPLCLSDGNTTDRELTGD